MKNIAKLEAHGFNGIKPSLEQKLAYMNEEILIFDEKLEKVLNKGTFVGINEFGHALLKTDGEIKTIIDGRMRKAE